MGVFKKGDIVTVKKGEHITTGCEEFHEQMEEWKVDSGFQFELISFNIYQGRRQWDVHGTRWCIAEADLELADFTLENE